MPMLYVFLRKVHVSPFIGPYVAVDLTPRSNTHPMSQSVFLLDTFENGRPSELRLLPGGCPLIYGMGTKPWLTP
jgi:hypothetical protein